VGRELNVNKKCVLTVQTVAEIRQTLRTLGWVDQYGHVMLFFHPSCGPLNKFSRKYFSKDDRIMAGNPSYGQERDGKTKGCEGVTWTDDLGSSGVQVSYFSCHRAAAVTVLDL